MGGLTILTERDVNLYKQTFQYKIFTKTFLNATYPNIVTKALKGNGGEWNSNSFRAMVWR
jgi:HKD family nuclease